MNSGEQVSERARANERSAKQANERANERSVEQANEWAVGANDPVLHSFKIIQSTVQYFYSCFLTPVGTQYRQIIKVTNTLKKEGTL